MARAIRREAAGAAEPKPAEGPGTSVSELPGSADAVREFAGILEGLEELGVLRFTNDLLRSEDRVVKVLTERVDPGELRRAVQGLRTLLRALGAVRPDLIARVSERFSPALEEALRAEQGAPVDIVEVVSALNDPEVNRGVRLLLGFLRGVGRVPPD